MARAWLKKQKSDQFMHQPCSAVQDESAPPRPACRHARKLAALIIVRARARRTLVITAARTHIGPVLTDGPRLEYAPAEATPVASGRAGAVGEPLHRSPSKYS